MRARILSLLFIYSLSPAVFSADRYVSSSGNDTWPGTLLMPYRTLDKAVTSAMPADNIIMRGGTYALRAGAGLVNIVQVKPYQSETVVFTIPNKPSITLDATMIIFTDVTAVGDADVRIILKPGGRLNNVRKTIRKTDTSRDLFITVNKSTVVSVE